MKNRNHSIRVKLTVITLIGVFVPTIILIASLMISLSKVGEKSQNVAAENLLAETKNSIKNEVQIICTNSENLYMNLKNTMDEQKLINTIFDNIRKSKYGDAGYFFVYSYDGVRFVAPENTANEGKDMLNTADKNGVMVVQEVIKNCKNGGGFITYIWKNPATNKDEEKITYSAPLKIGDKEYAVGTGTYLPMIELTKNQIRTTIANTRQDMLSIILPLCIIAALSLLLFSVFYYNRKLIKPINMLTGVANRIAIGISEDEIHFKSNDEIGKLVLSFSKMIENIRYQSQSAIRIAKGDLDFVITEKSDKDSLSLSMKEMMRSLKELVKDSDTIVNAAVEGKLDIRADSKKHAGDYKRIIEGLNNTLDAIVLPMNMGLEQLDKMANGEKIETLNNPYKGSYFTFINNLNILKDALAEMSDETDKVINESKNGNLSYRANTKNLKGNFAALVNGINDILDAIIKPVQEAANVLSEMAKGNLHIRVCGDYKGDHATIKNALNETISSLVAYVDEITYVLNEMAKGNLNLGINNEYKGEFTAIKDSLNKIINSLNDVLGDFYTATKQVSTISSQISDSSQSLAQGSTEQASTIEELTASIEEIAAQTANNAQNAEKANVLALAAKTEAVSGNEQMQNMLSAMTEIEESSSNIHNIIKVIDEIAFQTNILALNAAVEAARAGQHGKGFAVVAEEVRNLSARCARAAKETSDLIEQSMNTVEGGTNIAKQTADVLNKIVETVTEAAGIVGDITKASNNQAYGIAQINTGITQISTVVQQNSATSEQSAAVSQDLYSKAKDLFTMIGTFKIKRLDEK